MIDCYLGLSERKIKRGKNYFFKAIDTLCNTINKHIFTLHINQWHQPQISETDLQ